ncbi:hypothetical protein L1987_15453 [Smallanthus sonchifolius]|uniref:Uncharacterized protein n=1 Tax=Smallanthus sonchifolius TaxID=185202 RepID=A0ACB9J928_9ASTR|nr:hypothetical protein L1987_15453 [Smallanthus sonchifolius]
MTRTKWLEMIKSWKKVLPVSPLVPIQKERYVNKDKCVGRIISWFYDDEFKLFAIKRTDGVQYLKPRLKYFNSLPRCEINGQSTKPLINPSGNGIAKSIAKLIRIEGGSGKYHVKTVSKIPLKKIPQDVLSELKWWYVDVITGEAVVEDMNGRVLMRFFDAMNIINFSKFDQKMLKHREIMYTKEWRE